MCLCSSVHVELLHDLKYGLFHSFLFSIQTKNRFILFYVAIFLPYILFYLYVKYVCREQPLEWKGSFTFAALENSSV